MLPRASLVDGRRFAPLRRGAARLAWWRSPSIGRFVAGHAATAAALQLAALVGDLGRAGRPVPAVATLGWAWAGLAVLAVFPALLTVLALIVAGPRPVAARAALAFGVGLALYVAPVALLLGSLAPLGGFAATAAAWHVALGFAPVPSLGARRLAR